MKCNVKMTLYFLFGATPCCFLLRRFDHAMPPLAFKNASTLWLCLLTLCLTMTTTVWAVSTPPINAEGRVQLDALALKKQPLHLLPMRLITPLTEASAPNDAVEARLMMPVQLPNPTQVLPADSRLQGHITQNTPGQRYGRRAKMNIVWDAWCPASTGQACIPIPPTQTQQGSQYPAKVTGTSGAAFKRFVPLQLLSYGISIPLGLTAMPFWTTTIIEQGVGAAIGAGYETLKPEDPNAGKGKQLVTGALNSTSLPTVTRFVKKAPAITVAANTPIWMPIDTPLLEWMGAQPVQPANPELPAQP
jgi:hypothetical protein